MRTRERVERLEAELAPPAEPEPLRVEWRERSFESTEALRAWSDASHQRNRARRASPTALRVVVVRRCAPGEEPGERELSEAEVAGGGRC